MMLVCLHTSSPTQQAISRSGAFAVNVLAEGQNDLARQFARPGEDKFAGVAIRRGAGGLPLLSDALAVLECRVGTDLTGGTHRVFFAHVARATARHGAPLAYFRGSFGRIELDSNARALELLREYIIARRLPLDTPIEVGALADELELPPQNVYQALLTLTAEGLVSRRGESELVVTPIDREMVEKAMRARTAIEIGAAELTVGNVAEEQLQELRRRADATNGLVAGGHFVDIDAYIEADSAFHEYLVAMVGSDALLEAYRRLSIPALMARLFSRHDQADETLVREHAAVVEAYEAGSIDLAHSTIRAHGEHAQAANDAAILAGGGRI
jgi:4-nitrophenol 2-monooxygenase / 4-nitrocatechol 4-monooxygenase, reductase component